MIFRRTKKNKPAAVSNWHKHFVIFKIVEDPSRYHSEYIVILDVIERRRWTKDTFDRWDYRVSQEILKKRGLR